jgi:rhodanese-related sulfurtransferase
MARNYTTEEMRLKLLRGEGRFYLIDTLPRASYVNRHLPGALSLPVENIELEAERVLPDKDTEIIAYCSGPT